LHSNFAGVVELVDIPDLGSGAVRHGGSSPSTRTVKSLVFQGFYFFKQMGQSPFVKLIIIDFKTFQILTFILI
jgi:hypothetical protein